jgi:ABC-type transport system involved in cytochrome bd biosynthesis fused ATPase/permease subunit
MFPTLAREAFRRVTCAENLDATDEPPASSAIEAMREPVDRRLRDFCRAEVLSARIRAALADPVFVLMIMFSSLSYELIPVICYFLDA